MLTVFSEKTEPVKEGNVNQTVSQRLVAEKEPKKTNEQKMTVFQKMRVKKGN